MTSQLLRFWCLFLSCQQQRNTKKTCLPEIPRATNLKYISTLHRGNLAKAACNGDTVISLDLPLLKKTFDHKILACYLILQL